MIFKSGKSALHIPYKDITKVRYYQRNIQVKENKARAFRTLKLAPIKEFVLKKNDLSNSLYKALEFFTKTHY